jgi:two-component system response regulator AtoC
MARVLLVDDDPGVLFTLREIVIDRGHQAATARSAAEALDALAKAEADAPIDAVLTDLAMPGMNGLELLRAIHERDPAMPVLLLTAHGSEQVAVRAMKAGAYDYLTKPFDIDEIGIVIDRALETRRLRVENRELGLERAIGRRLIGQSAAMRRLVDAALRVAPRDVTGLVRGETGTGKELIATLLHAESKRSKKPLVRFNCAAIPAELAEAELFGHARGAFTGAQAARRGFFAQADGGTLVLDEIGELPMPVQAKLLRAIQDGEIQPVGSGRIEKVDVRMIASTNRDLAAEAKSGKFREDLYYRLAVVELVVPPLRERRDDIAPLAKELLRRVADKFGIDEISLSPALVRALTERDWPGNVRELENTIARLAALGSGGELDVAQLDPAPSSRSATRDTIAEGSDPDAIDPRPEPGAGPSLREQVEAFERGLIARALAAAHGNQSEAARRLGSSRATLIDKIKKHGLLGFSGLE